MEKNKLTENPFYIFLILFMILRLWQETCMPFLEVSRGLSRAASPTGLAGNFNKGARILFWSWTCDLFRSWNLHEVTQKEHKKHTFCPWKMSKPIKSPWSLEVNSAPPAFLSHFSSNAASCAARRASVRLCWHEMEVEGNIYVGKPGFYWEICGILSVNFTLWIQI